MRGLAHKIVRRLGREARLGAARVAPVLPWLRATRAAVLGSGFFDADWYLRQNPDVAELGIDPLDHFCAVGGFQLRDPGPHFWTSHAFEHTGRLPGIPLLNWLREKDFDPQPVPCAPLIGLGHRVGPSGLRVGFVVHAFYEDQIESLLTLPAAMVTPLHAYVAVMTDDGEREALRFADRFASMTVRRITNVGRNTGTWCSLFGPQILAECDVFCHVHSKRSVHLSRRAARAWKQGTFANLFGEGSYADEIVHQFELDAQLGVMSPAPPSGIDMAAYSDGANGSEVERLFRLLDLPSERPSFYDYPVGNMFWARTAAIGQLLDGRIGFDLFPPEAGQLDGTVAHAIERSVGLVAKANGFRYDECSAVSQSVRIGMGSRNLWNYPFRASTEELTHLVAEFPFIVLDSDGLVFTRAFSRNGLWEKVGQSIGFPGYAACRREAESRWPQVPVEETLRQFTDQGETALAEERRLELENLIPLAALREKLRGQGVYLLDHSLGVDHGREIFRRLGLDDSPLRIAEAGLSPRGTEYWTSLARSVGGTPDRTLFLTTNFDLLGALPPSTGVRVMKLMDVWTLYSLRRDQGFAPEGLPGTEVARRYGDPFEGR
jgi:hypothetical protein